MTTFSAKRAYRDAHVRLRFSIKGRDMKVDGSTDLSTGDARALAQALIDEADKSDARLQAKKAADERRQKWRDREMKIISFR